MERKIAVLKLLSDSDIEKIHNASVRVLAITGVEILHEGALRRLDELGCSVDYGKKRVRIPEAVIEEQVMRAPKSFAMAGRNPKYDIRLESNTVCARPTGGPDYMVDRGTDGWRKTTLTDVIEWAILTDALEHIAYGMGIYANDVPLHTRDVRTAEVMIENTEKHIQFQPLTPKNVVAMAEIAAVVQGGKDRLRERPLVSILISSLTPLRYTEDNVEMQQICARHGIPVMLNSSPQAGATGPVTLIGSVVLLNAENLAANAIVQALGSGTPVVYQIRPMVFDMRTAIPSFGSIEFGMMSALTVQLAGQRYGFITDIYGPVTDAKSINTQAMMEKTYNTLLPLLAGANIIAGAGLLEFNASVSPVQLVIDNDLMGAVFRVLKGADADDETLATEVINDVGPAGHFLDTAHTYKYFKKEYYMSDLCNRESRSDWESKGSRDMIQEAREKTKKILKEHKPVPLDGDVLKEIRSIAKSIEE